MLLGDFQHLKSELESCPCASSLSPCPGSVRFLFQADPLSFMQYQVTSLGSVSVISSWEEL